MITHLTVNLILQAAAVAAGSQDYATAFRATAESGRPLVVLVGADWCPACQQMKLSAIPELERKGGLTKVSFAYVNPDQQRELAGKLMQGSSIPQLIVYQKTESGWKRQQLTGARSASDIQAFLDSATEPSIARLNNRE